MSLIFFHDSEQEEIALQSKAVMEQKLGREIKTEIVAYRSFYLAEDYHQKYYLQGYPELALEIKVYYSSFQGFIDSTAAARLNGVLGGYSDRQLVAEEIGSYGLSDQAQEFLRSHLRLE